MAAASDRSASPSPRESAAQSTTSAGSSGIGGTTPAARSQVSKSEAAKNEGSKGKNPLSWLNSTAATLKSTAASLASDVSEIRAGAALAAQELAGNVQKGLNASKIQFSEERYDVVFIERPLGLKVDFGRGAVVFELTAGGQGERLQVRLGDRIIAINGKPLDPFDPAKPNAFIEDTQARMRVLGRPCNLTFLRLEEVAATEEAGDSMMEGLKRLQKRIPGGFTSEVERPPAELLAEVEAATALAKRFQQEAEEARDEARQQSDDAIAAVEEAAQLRADLAEMQLTKSWKLDEIHRSEAAAEAAQVAEAEMRERLLQTEQEMTRLLEERSLVEERAALRQRAVGEEAAEVQHLRERLCNAEVAAENEGLLRRKADELRCVTERKLDDAFRQIVDAQGCEAELRKSEASALAIVREARLAAEQRAGQLFEELSVAESHLSSEGRRAAALVAELEAARAEVPRLAAAERLVPELRREVERLRREVLLFESAAAGDHRGSGGAVADAESRIKELVSEVEQLRAALRRHEEGPSAGAQDVEWEQVPTPPAAVIPEPAPQLVGRADVSGSDALAADVFGDGSGGKQRRERVLEVRIAELDALNGQLTKQLNSRPIVFQFAQQPVEDDDDAAEEEEEEDRGPAGRDPEAMTSLPSTPVRAVGAGLPIGRKFPGAALGEGQPHEFPGPRVGGSAVALGAAVWVRRRCWRGFVACRKQRLTKLMEGQLRTFTRRMLQSPVLLWLFYVHVTVLWFLVTWRQAMSQPSLTDPVASINKQMVISQGSAGSAAAAAAATAGSLR